MAASPKRASTPAHESVINNTAFSIDSLQIGDSTRSLLSPLFVGKQNEEDGPFFGEKSLTKSELSYESSFESSDDISDDAYGNKSENIVKKGMEKERRKSSYSNGSSSRAYKTETSKKTEKKWSKSNSPLYSDSVAEQEQPLSPWEKWFLTKIIEDKKRSQAAKRANELKKEMKNRKMNEKTEQEKRAEIKRKEWLILKRNEEKLKNKLKAKVEDDKLQQKQEQQARIQMKADETYEKWLKAKEMERKELCKNLRIHNKSKKKAELERKQKSEEAYKLWLEKSKQHQKSENNHFGYIGGKVRCYYDWTTYPVPSYSNPNPWVSPKVRVWYQSKIKFQNPSPPLLFKDIEEREHKAKQKTQHEKCK